MSPVSRTGPPQGQRPGSQLDPYEELDALAILPPGADAGPYVERWLSPEDAALLFYRWGTHPDPARNYGVCMACGVYAIGLTVEQHAPTCRPYLPDAELRRLVTARRRADRRGRGWPS